MFKRNHLYTLLLVLFLTPFNSFSSHLMGGEITWTCDGSGNFIFRVKMYRDCNGVQGPPSINLATNALTTSIHCPLVQQNDISPTGTGCPTCLNPMGFASATEEFIYESASINLPGTPPPFGWYFYYTDCCRNGAITNLATGTGWFTLRAIMYPFAGAPSGCSDNSPQFAISPTLALCSGDSVRFTHAAFDPDLDSLVYSWDSPLDSSAYPGIPYPFEAGYSATSPLPGLSQNPLNQPAILDSGHGIISFLTYTTGSFVTVNKVQSYKCGQLVSEVFREVQMAIILCPIINAPFPTNNVAPIFSTGNEIESFTLVAGDTFFYAFNIADSNLTYSPSPTPQVVTINAFGSEFGSGFSSYNTGCPIVPCAILNNPTPFSSVIMAAEEMTWPTACSHAGFTNGCLQHQRTFQFVFTAKDDFCPANGMRHKSLLVSVTGPEIYAIGNDLAVSYPGVTLQWYLNGAPIPGATDTIITPTQSGIYTVMATTGGGCQMVSNTVSRTVSSTQDFDNQAFYSVYPNPTIAGQQIQLLIKDFATGQQEINIHDLNGRLVKSYLIRLHNPTEHLVLDISGLVAGTYSFSITNSSGIHQKSFVIQ
jgi:hypothetical protein